MEARTARTPRAQRGTESRSLTGEHLDISAHEHQSAHVRTTLTLDDDLAKRLKELAREGGRSFKEVSNPGVVGLPWAVILGFVRIMSSNIVVPGPRHLEILADIMGSARASGRLTTDAHLAALAIETQSELHSNDVDFARFPGLRWRNPIG